MGFSTVAATAIVGVALVMAIEIIVGTTIPTITDVHGSYDDMKDRAIEQVQTDVNITAASTSANASNYDLNITIENTGSVTLKTNSFDVLINGTKNKFQYSKLYLYPKNTVYFEVYNISGSETARLKIVTNNGIEEYYDYTIT